MKAGDSEVKQQRDVDRNERELRWIQEGSTVEPR